MQTLAGPGAGPRAALTQAQVIAAYQGDALAVDYGCELVRSTTSGYVKLAELNDTGDVEGGTVDRDCLGTIHGTCKINVARDLAWGADRLRPWMSLPGGVRWNLGVFLVTTPTTSPGLSVRRAEATGWDMLWFLNQPIADSVGYAAGTPVLDAVRAVIASAPGASSVVLLDGFAAAKTLPTDMTWALTETSQPTFLAIVNALLDVVAYRGLWADEEGARRGPRPG